MKEKKMTHLQSEIQRLRDMILEMMQLVHRQLKKSEKAFLNNDADIAEEVIHNEKRVNALELSIDRQCENIFALFNPVATDLRFVVSMLKINSDLERMGDYADGISDYVVEYNDMFKPELIEALKIEAMFDKAIAMVENMMEAFQNKDMELARIVFKKDIKLNKINENAPEVIKQLVKEDPEVLRQCLFMFSTLKKLERLGDHVKNISEEMIFYIEAEILKHQKEKKKLLKK